MKKDIKKQIRRDYAGFFENWVDGLIEELHSQGNTMINKIIINSGPYRNYGMDYEIKDDGHTVELDFYSAVRVGFGNIGVTQHDFAEILIQKTTEDEEIIK